MTQTNRRLAFLASAAVLLLLAMPAVAQDAETPADDPASENPMWDHVSQRFDANADGQVTQEEFTRKSERFQHMDRDQDGVLTAADFEGLDRVGPGPGHHRRGRGPAVRLMELADTNADGQLSRDEWTGYLATLDSNTDGKLGRDELEATRPADAPDPSANRPQRDFEISVERLTEAFDHFDANEDGVITADEKPRRRGPRGPRNG